MQNILGQLKNKFKNKKVLIVGLGNQGGGVGLAQFFSQLGARVTVTDKKNENELENSLKTLRNLPIQYRLGYHALEDFIQSDVIFKGPSVPWTLPEIIEAEKRGVPIEMESSFFASVYPGPIIGITGTRGKSTTTMLIYQLLGEFNFQAHLAGNISHVSTISLLPKINPSDYVVMELSSWQLSGFHRKKISPHIAVFTNLYPDHLNYYKTMDDYLYDKKAIYLYQKPEDYLIAHESLLQSIHELKSQLITYNANDFPYILKYLKGQHNRENAAAVFTLSQLLHMDQGQTIKQIQQFQGIPYRQEIIAKKGAITFVNDTTSTTPTATIKAIESFAYQPTVLILGGNSKNLPYSELIRSLTKVRKIILLKGSFTEEILPYLKQAVPQKISATIFGNLEEAVNTAYQSALAMVKMLPAGASINVLFSPGATSFAMFRNEFHRGEEFNKVVKKII